MWDLRDLSAPVSTTSVVGHTGRLPGVRLNEHIAPPESALVFQQGDRVKALGLALPFRRAGLVEVQEPRGSRGEAGGGGGLAMETRAEGRSQEEVASASLTNYALLAAGC